MIKQRPTKLQDIARELNISTSTVSKALNGVEQINPRTRKAVENMAKRLNYEPNQIAQSLRNNKTKILGVVVPNLVSHFFAACISGMQDVAASSGYNLIICQSNESYQKEVKVVQTLIASRVDGLLLSLSSETETYKHLETVFSRGIPLVLYDRTCEAIKTSKVTVDDHDGAFKAVEHLIEMGYKRIAHLSGPEYLSISKSRLKGYLDALERNGIEADQEIVCHSSLREDDVVQKTRALISLPHPPDAIFAITDMVATKAMQVIKAKGMRIPNDIALIGFTNIPEASHIEPTLTTVAQPAYQMGKIAVHHILEQIEHPEEYVPQSIVLNTNLVIRNSTLNKAMHQAVIG